MAKVGSFSICTIPYDQLETYAPTVVTKTKKTRQAKVAIYPIFETYASLTTDKFWQSKLQAAANNKFPRGFSYAEGVLTYRKGTKKATLELAEHAPRAFEEVIEFFHIHGSIYSPGEEQACTVEPVNVVSSREQINWGKTSKKMQELLLGHYVEELRQQYQLSSSETLHTLKLLTKAVNEKYFHKDNIHMQDNTIERIDGWMWQPEQRQFVVDPQLLPVVKSTKASKSTSKSTNDTSPNFSKLWFTYLKQLQPNCNFEATTTTRDLNTDLLTDDY